MSYESNPQKMCKEELNRSYFEANYIKAGNMMNVTPQSQYSQDGNFQRKRIISLVTGQPVKPYVQLTSFQKKVQLKDQLFDFKRAKVAAEKPSLVTTLQDYFSLMEEEKRNKQSEQAKNMQNNSQISQSQAQKYQSLQNRVVNNEFNLIKNCEEFLRMKKLKNVEFEELVTTAQRDRAKTQELRMRTYSVSERRRISELRRTAERKRRQEVERNQN